MIAVLDLTVLAPGFMQAVANLHNTLVGVAEVSCVAGLSYLCWLAFHEKHLHSVNRGIIWTLIVALLVGNLQSIGNVLSDATASISSAIGLGNGNLFPLYTAAIKQKFGVDVSQLNSLVPNGPYGGTNPSAASGGSTVSHYGYAGDSTSDPNSANGIGAWNNKLVAGQSLALTPDLSAGLSPHQAVTVQLANGSTLSGYYDDNVPANYNGVTLSRVDVYDPNNVYGDLSGIGVTGITGGAQASGGNPVTDFIGAMIHPSESLGVIIFGVITLFFSYLAVGIAWIVAFLQAVLFYAEIALSPIFLGLLIVPGLQNMAKHFLLGFVAVCLWPIAFTVTGLLATVPINLALNTANNTAAGAANVMGMTYFWLIVAGILVLTGSIAGPWLISRAFLAGSTGISALMVASAAAGASAYRSAVQTASRMVGSMGNGSAPQTPSVRSMDALRPNYASRPITPKQDEPSQRT